MTSKAIKLRVQRGWDLEEALTTPVRPTTRKIDVNGHEMTFAVALSYLKVSQQAVNSSAHRRKITPAEEIQRRFAENPGLLPRSLQPEGTPQALLTLKSIRPKP